MGRRKKDGEIAIKSFSLTKDQAELISYYASANEFGSDSEFLGWLIENYDAISDPHKELILLEEQERRLLNEVSELKPKKIKILQRIEAHKEDEKLRKDAVLDTIEMLKRKIIEGTSYLDIQRLAKNRAMRLNMDALELIFRASQEVRGLKNAS